MTALCGGGASRPKAGVAETIIFTTSQIGSFLNNKGGLWASLAIGALGVLSYEATALCDSDPPAQPTILASDYKALLELGPFDQLQVALGKLKDLVTVALWYDLCECASIATPAPPAALLTPPANVTLPDYGLSPCAQPRLRTTVRNGYNVFGPLGNITRDAFPNLEYAVSVAGDTDHPAQEIAQIPVSWLSMHSWTQLISGTTPVGQAYAVTISFYDQNRVPTVSFNIGSASTQNPYLREPQNTELAIPATARYFALNTTSNPTVTVPGTIDWALTVNCSGTQTTNPGCCADPVLYGLVNQLMQQVQLIRTDTEVLQRYGLPFAYVPGATHTGLTQTGSLPLARSVGLRINVTQHPVTNQVFLGQPPYIFDLGWISVLTPDGLLDEIRLTRTATTWMSKLIPSATQLGYGLREGVTINITELHAEP